MKVLILTASNPYHSAGVVALDLYRGLSTSKNIEVKVLVKQWAKYPDKNVIALDTYFGQLWKRIVRKGKKTLKIIGIKNDSKDFNVDYAVQDYDQTVTWYKTKKLLKKISFKPDAIIVLFMQHFLSFKNLHQLNVLTEAPIYLYMMDMAPMTGGCHYAWGCKGYLKNCGKCPALFSNTDNDQSRKNWEFKKQYIDQTDLTVIAATEYQFRQLQNSSLFGNKLKKKILLSVDQEIFKPTDKTEARNYFKLPLNEKILFFGAVTASEKRKGFKELVEALKLLKTIDPKFSLHLAIAGNASNLLTCELPYNYTFLGYLDYITLSKAFNAADAFLSPSIEDSGPMMINQSLACGTPAIAFDIGVAQDLVIYGKTGYLVKRGDTKDMATGIIKILNLSTSEYETYQTNCISFSNSLCNPKLQAMKFIDLINDVVKS